MLGRLRNWSICARRFSVPPPPSPPASMSGNISVCCCVSVPNLRGAVPLPSDTVPCCASVPNTVRSCSLALGAGLIGGGSFVPTCSVGGAMPGTIPCDSGNAFCTASACLRWSSSDLDTRAISFSSASAASNFCAAIAVACCLFSLSNSTCEAGACAAGRRGCIVFVKWLIFAVIVRSWFCACCTAVKSPAVFACSSEAVTCCCCAYSCARAEVRLSKSGTYASPESCACVFCACSARTCASSGLTCRYSSASGRTTASLNSAASFLACI